MANSQSATAGPNEKAPEITTDCRAPANVAHMLSDTVCTKKINAAPSKIFVLGIFAGAYIAFGAALATLVGHDAAAFVGVGLGKFMTGAVFSVGLMLVVIAGSELFTGNNLMLMTVLDRRASLGRMLNKWALVYIANFIGSMLLVVLYYLTDLWKSNDLAVGIAALKIANAKVNLSFIEALARGILCNWLVCLAVYLAFASRNVIGKIFSCFFPIMAFVASGFEHSVANMYFIPQGLFLKGTQVAQASGLDLANLTWGGFILNNLLPVTIGNIIGGSLLVGMGYWYVYVRDTDQ